MTFIEEVRELYRVGSQKKKEEEARAAAEHQKKIAALAEVIDSEVKRCRDVIRESHRSGNTESLLDFKGHYQYDVAKEVANKFRSEGFRVSSPYFVNNFLLGFYRVDVSTAW